MDIQRLKQRASNVIASDPGNQMAKGVLAMAPVVEKAIEITFDYMDDDDPHELLHSLLMEVQGFEEA